MLFGFLDTIIFYFLGEFTRLRQAAHGPQRPKGSRRNNFTFSRVEAPAWQGAKRANSKLFNRRATQPGGMDRVIKM